MADTQSIRPFIVTMAIVACGLLAAALLSFTTTHTADNSQRVTFGVLLGQISEGQVASVVLDGSDMQWSVDGRRFVAVAPPNAGQLIESAQPAGRTVAVYGATRSFGGEFKSFLLANALLFGFLVIGAAMVAYLWADIATRPVVGLSRLGWGLVVLLTFPVGPVIYLIAGRGHVGREAQGAVVLPWYLRFPVVFAGLLTVYAAAVVVPVLALVEGSAPASTSTSAPPSTASTH